MHKTGDVLQGRYQIEKPLGQGGMGGVYLAMHQALEAKVAIKEMTLLFQTDDDRVASVRQFKKEAQILHLLRHDHLPRVHDFFEEDGKYYLVMDYIQGRTLEELVATKPLSEDQLHHFGRQLCSVLEYLHGYKPPIIFRDLKPSNIMQTEDGNIKLIDFGIAKDFDVKTGRGTQTSARGAGTPGFAAPEQYGAGSDVRTDIYALGATLYSLLTRLVPPDSVDIASGGAELQPLLDLRPDVSPATARVIEWMLSINRTHRPSSIQEVSIALGYGTQQAPFSVLPQRVLDQIQTDQDRVNPNVTHDLSKIGGALDTKRPPAPHTAPAPAATPAPQEVQEKSYSAPGTFLLHSEPAAVAPKPPPSPRRSIALPLTAGLAALAVCAGLVLTHLSPHTVTVHLTSKPPGASIIVNDTPYQVTPEDIPGVPDDRPMHVELTLKGYSDYSRQLSVSPSPPPIELQPAPTLVHITGTPVATVDIDGKKTPQESVLLLPGSHKVHVHATGYKDFNTLVSIKLGQDTAPPVKYSLQAIPVSLTLKGLPTGAHIRFAEGKFTPVPGATLPTFRKLPPGTYPLHVEAAGYNPLDQAVVVTAGHENSYTYSMERLSAAAPPETAPPDPDDEPRATVTVAPESPPTPEEKGGTPEETAPPPVATAVEADWSVQPGVAIGPVHIRQSEDEVKAQFHLYYTSSKDGIEEWVGLVDGRRAIRIGFSDGVVVRIAVSGPLLQRCSFQNGVRAGASRDQILAAYGPPMQVDPTNLRYQGAWFQVGPMGLHSVTVHLIGLNSRRGRKGGN